MSCCALASNALVILRGAILIQSHLAGTEQRSCLTLHINKKARVEHQPGSILHDSVFAAFVVATTKQSSALNLDDPGCPLSSELSSELLPFILSLLHLRV